MKITEETMRQQALKESGALPESNEPAPETPPEPHRTEREKLHAMSRKDQIWYIWNYYKFHILGVILACVAVYVVGSSLYRTTFDTVMHCMYLNSQGTEEVSTAPLEEDFASWMEFGKKELVVAENAFISFDNSATEYSYAMMAKITALVMAHDLDIMIGDTSSTNHYASMSGFENLETLLPADLLALVKDRLYYAKDENGSEYACAIDISQTDFVQDSHLYQKPPLLAVVAGSRNTENSIALIRYILAPESAK